MSDYDTIPATFSPPMELPNGGAFTGFSRHVPAVLCGNASEWMRMILLMIDKAEQNIGKVKLFSDMMALAALSKPVNHTFITSDVRVVKGETLVAALTSPNDTTKFCSPMAGNYAVHFSHAVLKHVFLNTTSKARDTQRGSVMSSWRRQYEAQCRNVSS